MNILSGGRDVEIQTALGARKLVVWDGDPTLRPYVIVAGYCQSVTALALWLVALVLHGRRNTIIAVERLGIGTNDRPDHIGWQGLGSQLKDFVAIIEAMLAEGWIRESLPPIWIVHSLGGHLLAELRLLYPALVKRAVLDSRPKCKGN